MRRFHLFELEDLDWFPVTIRDMFTDYLRFVVRLFGMYKPVTPILEKILESQENHTVIDLASGGGGPWPSLAPLLKAKFPDFKVTLSDYYPNKVALTRIKNEHPDAIDAELESVNALDVPERLQGLRTQFLSLHHFAPDQVASIFQNAIDARQPIAVFEFQERSINQVVQFAFSPIMVLLLTPFIRPFTLSRLFWTYIIPVVPLGVMWDGCVSALRTYTVQEIQDIIATLNNQDTYDWDVQHNKIGPAVVFHATGVPK